MAYTVGSASVDIVPDFRRAQLEITKFFNSQPDQFKIPVKLDIKQADSKAAEEQARVAGARVSKAMSEGAGKNDKALLRETEKLARERAKAMTFAHGEALKIQAQMDREAVKARLQAERDAAKAAKAILDEETKARIQADRDIQRTEAERARALQQAHTEALRLNAQFDREAEAAARRQAKSEEDARRQRLREEEAAARQSMKIAEAMAAQRRKIEEQSAAESARIREKMFREQEREFQASLKQQTKAIDFAIREAAREKLQIEIDEQKAIKDGRSAGGLISRAVKEEVHQNAGLIALAIGGALAAGAPVATAATTALFAGIGAAAAFQNDKLRQSWMGLWQDIKSGAVADAASLVPVFDRMAGAIGQSFQRMRPLLRDAFEAVGPQIDSLTGSLLKMAENALPGIVRAVQNANPVVQGLGDLFEKTGTGVSDFFDKITEHSDASGAVLSQLGDSMGILLPLLGELIGQGAELAATVLPSVNAGLSTLLTVANALGGALPVLGTAFLSFRLAQGATRYITGLSQSLLDMSAKGGMASGVMGNVATGLSRVAGAMPAIAAGAVTWGIIFQQSASQIHKWSQAMNEGGEAARKAKADMDEYDATMGKIGTVMDTTAAKTNIFTASTAWAWKMLSNDTDEAKKANDEYLKSLTPLESAQRALDIATKELAKGLDDEGTSANKLAGLKADVARAAARQAAEEDKLAMATRGVTEAMQEQADAARARVDSAFGYQQAVLDTADAQMKLKDALASTDYDTPAEKTAAVAQATLDYNQALADQAQAAADVATSDLPASMDDTQKAVIGAKAALDELNKIMATGVKLPPELEAYRQNLIAITGGADSAALAQATLIASLGEVGAAVSAIPDSKAVRIEMPTDALVQKLKDLGFEVKNLPGGAISVEAKTDQAKTNLGQLSTLLATLNTTTAEPTAAVNDQATKPLNDIFGLTQILGGAKPTPVASVNDQATNPFRNLITLSDFFAGKKPTPTATVNDQASTPFNNLIGLSNVLGGKKPTPTVAVNNQASGPLNTIQAQLNAIRDKRVTITTTYVKQFSGYSQAEILGGFAGAKGGAVEAGGIVGGHYKFDGGGAVTGRGSAVDDLVPAIGPDPTARYSIANGEHILDGRDVALMGGQAGVYAFREMLNSGALRRPASDTGVRQMVMAGAPRIEQQRSGPIQDVRLYTPDVPSAIRALNAARHEAEALAPVWP